MIVSKPLLEIALEKGASIDQLEKLIELKNREEDRQCKKDFDFHFSEMQGDYKPAYKNMDVQNKEKTKTLYKFCPIENILEVYQPIISKHNFTYRWDEETISESVKRVFCIVSGYGHEVKSYVDIPIMPGTLFTNSIQQVGVSSSYGRRYSFINAFGVVIKGEDDDTASLTYSDGVEYANDETLIAKCSTLDELKSYWTKRYHDLSTDGKRILGVRVDLRKKELQGEGK